MGSSSSRWNFRYGHGWDTPAFSYGHAPDDLTDTLSRSSVVDSLFNVFLLFRTPRAMVWSPEGRHPRSSTRETGPVDRGVPPLPSPTMWAWIAAGCRSLGKSISLNSSFS